MSLKKLIPSSFRQIYTRVTWFIRNYRYINSKSVVRSIHFHGPITYDTDGLCTSNNCDFINEPRFARAYALAVATQPWSNFTLQWRVYVVCWFADHVKCLDGDFVECGVNTGAYSRAVIDYIDFAHLKKEFFLLDTFHGLVESQITAPESEAGIDKYLGVYKNVYDQVVNTFRGFNVKIIQGVVPDTLKECSAEKVCYLSIDMNVVEPEIAAIDFFWDKVVDGGVIILDDYGFPQHINQKIAFDLFAKEKGISILSLPTGQGIIIKKGA